MVIQLAFSGTMCLAALSTVLDVVNHRSKPTPFGTQHVGKQGCLPRHESNPNLTNFVIPALLLAGWGPLVVFGTFRYGSGSKKLRVLI
jgi:hypothetical protein